MAILTKVRTVMTGVAGSPYYSNFYFADADDDAADCVAKVRAFWVALNEQLRVGATVTFDPEVMRIDSETGDVVGTGAYTAAAVPMNSVAFALPPATQALVRLRTNTFNGGRRIQGRIYVPNLTTDWNTGGQVNSGKAATLTTAATALATGSGPQLVIYSRTYGTFGPVSTASVWNQFSVLRSRRD